MSDSRGWVGSCGEGGEKTWVGNHVWRQGAGRIRSGVGGVSACPDGRSAASK